MDHEQIIVWTRERVNYSDRSLTLSWQTSHYIVTKDCTPTCIQYWEIMSSSNSEVFTSELLETIEEAISYY